jgi:hypothetical protein
MYIEILGWISTLLVLIGYWSNSVNKRDFAFITWILGDIGWITYDILIQNWSHMALSGIIIMLNLYGMYRIMRPVKKQFKTYKK